MYVHMHVQMMVHVCTYAYDACSRLANIQGTCICMSPLHWVCYGQIHDYSQLPWLQTAIHYMGLCTCTYIYIYTCVDVKKRESARVQDVFLPILGFIDCAGVTESGHITCSMCT